jgi:DNA-directed RNA polymerase specialized sigma24 family protein
MSKKKLVQAAPKLYPVLDKKVAEILMPGSSNTVFIACTAALKRFGLQNKYDAAFVVNEAYLRARKTLDAEKEISNYTAWLRSTNFNIVRELSKAEKKNRNRSSGLEVDSIPVNEANTWTEHELESVEQQHMRKAFATLSPLEQAILQLKIVKQLKWADIQPALIAAGFESSTPNLLSQKKRRALKKLKEAYQRINV